MSWIQENKFVAGLIGVTAVVGGVIIFYGSSQGSQYEDKLSEYDSLKATYRNLQKSIPYPSQGNLEVKRDNIAKYEEVINDVRNTFDGFQAGKMANISPEEFSNMRVKMEKELRAAFEDGTELPEGTAFGFEKYKDSAARSEATGMLKYELDAVQSLLADLAKASPSRVSSILRTQLDVETGRAAAPPEPTSARNKRRGGRKAAAEPVKKAYELMPMEVSFTASESGVRQFLKAMVNSKEYFYAIRALRIRNEKQVPPGVKDADFPSGGAGSAPADGPAGEEDPFAGIVLPGDPEGGGEGEGSVPVPAPPDNDVNKPATKEGERIIKRVLGAEELHVFIRFDIVFIKDNALDKKSGTSKR